MNYKVLTEKEENRLLHILDNTKSWRVRKKVIRRIMGETPLTFTDWKRKIATEVRPRIKMNMFDRVHFKKIVPYNGRFYVVSTVSLGVDIGYFGMPLWYETMIFESDEHGEWNGPDLFCNRYSTVKQAAIGHQRAIEALRRGDIDSNDRG